MHPNKSCNELLSWRIEIWMKNHLINLDEILNCFLQGMVNNVRFALHGRVAISEQEK